jgi:hypothetical protein
MKITILIRWNSFNPYIPPFHHSAKASLRAHYSSCK